MKDGVRPSDRYAAESLLIALADGKHLAGILRHQLLELGDGQRLRASLQRFVGMGMDFDQQAVAAGCNLMTPALVTILLFQFVK